MLFNRPIMGRLLQRNILPLNIDNNEDYIWHSYTVQVTKMGRLIMDKTKHIQPTALYTEQFLWVLIKKATGWFENVFIQAAEVTGLPMPWSSDCRMEVTPGKT